MVTAGQRHFVTYKAQGLGHLAQTDDAFTATLTAALCSQRCGQFPSDGQGRDLSEINRQ